MRPIRTTRFRATCLVFAPGPTRAFPACRPTSRTIPFDLPGRHPGHHRPTSYAGRFFGVVDTVNGVGSNTNTATWTFNNILVPLDPKLGPLVDNGGPTVTHALLAGSPALNMGNPAAVAGVGTVPQFDQRGAPFGRVFGGRIDIGAFEQQSLNWVVDTLADESDGNYGPGDLSLREAINLARGSFSPSTRSRSPRHSPPAARPPSI